MSYPRANSRLFAYFLLYRGRGDGRLWRTEHEVGIARHGSGRHADRPALP